MDGHHHHPTPCRQVACRPPRQPQHQYDPQRGGMATSQLPPPTTTPSPLHPLPVTCRPLAIGHHPPAICHWPLAIAHRPPTPTAAVETAPAARRRGGVTTPSTTMPTTPPIAHRLSPVAYQRPQRRRQWKPHPWRGGVTTPPTTMPTTPSRIA